MEKVLIFGVSGFVGRYLSKEFLDNNYEVYGSDKNVAEMLPKEVKFKASDLLNAIQTEKLISEIDPDIIVNLAAVSSVGASWNIPQDTIDINVIGALNIMEPVRKSKKRPKIMFIGSSEEYVASPHPMNEDTSLDASNPYGISKVTQERFAKLYRNQYGLKIYCVRPFNHTGVGQRDSFVLSSFCKQVAEIEVSGEPGVIKVGNLAAKRDFTDVRDIVRAYRMIIESDDCTKIYNVGSGKAYGLDELLNYIISLSDQKISVKIDSARFRPVDIPVICCDYSRIKNELGWKPEHDIKDTLKEMYIDFKNK